MSRAIRSRRSLRFDDRPRGGDEVDLGGGILSPGFVDWQINGGGGVLFNANPTVEGIAAIAAAHRRAGVTAFLPTVVTDAPRVLDAALAAAREARERVPGALGIHVEGPFIDPRRKGVHPPEFIRPMRDADANALIAARAGVMVVTLAPASVPLEFIARLAKAGIVVSLGHSDASAEEAQAVFDAGASAVTHLYNAMSQLSSRAPGVVGATLADPRILCGLIADGEHAHALGLSRRFGRQGTARHCARVRRHAARRRRPGRVRTSGPTDDAGRQQADRRRRHARRRGDHHARRCRLCRQRAQSARSPTR